MSRRLVKEKEGILLDLGSGTQRRKGFVHLDRRRLPGIDIVWDMERFPWPLKSNSCITVVASQIVEHIKPWLFIKWMDEVWRVTKVGGQMAISCPYGVNSDFVKDPTHCNPCSETTWTYFDPRFPLYSIYEPKPWTMTMCSYQTNGVLEVILEKRLPEKKRRERHEKS